MCPKITQRGIGKLENNRLLCFQERQSYCHKFCSAPRSPISCSFSEYTVLTTAKPIQLNTLRLFSLDTPLINTRAARGCQVGQFPLPTMVSEPRNLSNHSDSCLGCPPHTAGPLSACPGPEGCTGSENLNLSAPHLQRRERGEGTTRKQSRKVGEWERQKWMLRRWARWEGREGGEGGEKRVNKAAAF